MQKFRDKNSYMVKNLITKTEDSYLFAEIIWHTGDIVNAREQKGISLDPNIPSTSPRFLCFKYYVLNLLFNTVETTKIYLIFLNI
jgi:hypothetical protein